ncbi:hypothetical protein F1599_15500 [Cupriavidus cauae]|uniref:Uncharacterized protein n=1 Tax=Cupriavidus cauae TaxID=2608999 RepID=A0A5M8AJU1_9BURK|nr:hypothetical protein F1599_15500 [Cupriavidus cauae]
MHGRGQGAGHGRRWRRRPCRRRRRPPREASRRRGHVPHRRGAAGARTEPVSPYAAALAAGHAGGRHARHAVSVEPGTLLSGARTP